MMSRTTPTWASNDVSYCTFEAMNKRAINRTYSPAVVLLKVILFTLFFVICLKKITNTVKCLHYLHYYIKVKVKTPCRP